MPDHEDDIIILGEIIESCKEVKFLGVTLDEHCTFETHFNQTIAKVTLLWAELAMMSKLKTNSSNLLRLYKVFTRSVMEYASPVLICAEKRSKINI